MEKQILLISYIFIVGSVMGWVIEVLYRRINNEEGKWRNPGLLSGPWLPIYGFGTTFLYWISSTLELLNPKVLHFNLLLFVVCSIVMSSMELVGGSFLDNVLHIRLWDYRDEKFNYKGYTCLKFLFIWGITSLIYYHSIHRLIILLINRYFSNIGILSFVVGITWGIFLVDLWNSMGISLRISKFAKEKNIVIDFEKVKDIAKNNYQEEKYAYRQNFFQVPRKENIIDFLKEHEPHISINKHKKTLKEKKMKRTCVQCGKEFYLSNSEIRYFKQRKLALPKRCKECRELNKAKKQEVVNNTKENKGFIAKLLSIFKK